MLSLIAAVTIMSAAPVGGAYSAGSVFLVEKGQPRVVLYDFCSQENCFDGATPLPTLLPMGDGTFIGATSAGGLGAAGVLYRLTPTATGAWTEDVLVDFCPYYQDCTHYGTLSQIWSPEKNAVNGIMQTSDGLKGVYWHVKINKLQVKYRNYRSW